jgi:menaquinone-dependent protoporphyrinogen oxidase
MKTIAIVTSSDCGHTTRIAQYIANQLDRFDLEAEIFNLSRDTTCTSSELVAFDGVLIGCPVYLGDFSQLLVDWTWDRHDLINRMPSALFTVSLNAADPRPKAREVDDRVLHSFMDQTNIEPRFVASLGGALEFTQYGFFKRCILQGVSAAAGGPTDTSRDFDLTNWNDVQRFVRAFHYQDMGSDFATVNRLPHTHQPNWPMALPRVA